MMDKNSKAKLKPEHGSRPSRACRGNIGHEKRRDPKTSSADPPYCWCDVPLGDYSFYCTDRVYRISPRYGSSSRSQVGPSRPMPSSVADAGKKRVYSERDTPSTPAFGPEQTHCPTFWW